MRTRLLATVAAVVSVLGGAGGALAAPPTYVLDTTFIPGVVDPDHNFLIFWNTTRDAFCTWVERDCRTRSQHSRP